MKKREIPRICTVDEFAKSKQLDADTLLYLTPEEFGNAMAGLKPGDLPPVGVGFDIVPLPGGGGFVGFPVCGPGEVPVIRNGVIRCVPSEFEDTDEPREPIGEQCGFRLIPGGGTRCEGSCPDENARCVRLYALSGGSFSIRCACVRLVSRTITIPYREPRAIPWG